MVLMKLYCHLVAEIKKTIYRIVNGNRVSFGRGFTFRKGFNLVVSKEGKVEIGENCFFNNGCSINCLNHIEIGEGSIFGEGVRIYDHNHRFADFSKPIKEQGYSQGSVKVGKHCWVGSNVVLLKGADIGDNCVIGAGCVVTGKVESGNLVKLPYKNAIEPIKNGGGSDMSDLISVIVPVYKVEEVLLRKSLESILKQTHSNIELLVVDDGSPDNCGEICDEYARFDKRMSVFHIDNHGVSFARNFALDRAKGSYVYFVDSDDYLEEDTLEKMLSTMKENNCDCVMCASNHVNEVDMEDKQPKEEIMDDIKLTQKQAVEALCYLEQPFDGYEMAAIWGTLYKKECIGEIRFNTKMKIGEDFEFKYKVFLNVESVICMKEKFYNYLIREKSAMRNGFDTTKIESATELQKLLKSEFALPEYKKALQSRVCNIVIVVLFMIPVEKKYEPYRKPIKVFLSENRKEVIKNPKSRNKVRGALLLSYIGFDFVQKLFFSARG